MLRGARARSGQAVQAEVVQGALLLYAEDLALPSNRWSLGATILHHVPIAESVQGVESHCSQKLAELFGALGAGVALVVDPAANSVALVTATQVSTRIAAPDPDCTAPPLHGVLDILQKLLNSSAV